MRETIVYWMLILTTGLIFSFFICAVYRPEAAEGIYVVFVPILVFTSFTVGVYFGQKTGGS